MIERILSLLKKEFIQIARDKKLRFVVLVAPILQLLIFGYAAVIDIKHIATGICDRDQSAASRELIYRLKNSDYFDLKYFETDNKRLTFLMDSEKINAIIEIPVDFEKKIKAGQSAQVRITADGSNSVAASIIVSNAGSIIQNYGQELLLSKYRFPFKGGLFSMESRAFFNPALENRFYYIPGIIAMIIIIVGMNLTAMSIVREKEQGTLEQLIVTPIRSAEMIIGKILPYTIIVLTIISFQIFIARLWFKVPFRGELWVLYLGILLFLIVALGLGIFISTISRTQQQAMLTGFFLTMPFIMLSGFMFPVENMPKTIQIFTYLNPMRYFLVCLRVIFLKGSGLNVLWPDYLALLILGIIICYLSISRFRKRME